MDDHKLWRGIVHTPITKYQIPAFVGGARRTCKATAEGFPNIARDLAKYYLTVRRDRFEPALRGGRNGYLLMTGGEYVTFPLVDNEEEMTDNILTALYVFAERLDAVPEHRLKTPYQPFGMHPHCILQ